MGGNTAPHAPKTIPPFDDEDADVIVKSSDGDEFRLYKVILAKASHVFGSAFSIPQGTPPASTLDPPEVIDGLPAIYLTEDTRTLTLMFSLCYPMIPPVLDSLHDVYNLLEAAMK